MKWQNWLNGILGLWVIVASYLYVPSGTGQVVMFIIGLVVAILGFWAGSAEPDYNKSQRHLLQH